MVFLTVEVGEPFYPFIFKLCFQTRVGKFDLHPVEDAGHRSTSGPCPSLSLGWKPDTPQVANKSTFSHSHPQTPHDCQVS